MADDFDTRVATAYKTDGAAVELGRGLLKGEVHQGATVQVPASMMNRHGLIAGATGTGKTKTLQLMAEQLSALGVPVFAADIKGDLSGLTRPGTADDRVQKRVGELGLQWTAAGFPVTFLSLGGNGPGVPVRAPVSAFGASLMAKVLGANDTQASSLALVFRYAREKGHDLAGLDDLRSLLQYLTTDGKAELAALGGVSTATAGVLLRNIVQLDEQGAAAFFGEPTFTVADLIRTTPEGNGVISCLELAAVQDKPELFSTFLMWLLGELFATLPEVGDVDKPKLVFFFDEAHLLFEGASKDLLDQVAQTVRLIRSKGVGVFFVTQLPDDVPEEVLAQLGNRVQHALRAFTPRDAKALKAAVTTYPKTPDYDLEEDLTQLGTGEAMVTILSERGAPTPVVWTRLRPPSSLMAAIDAAEIDRLAHDSSLWPKYAQRIERETAKEQLDAAAAARADAKIAADEEKERAKEEKAAERSAPRARRSTTRRRSRSTSVTSEVREARQTVNTVLRIVNMFSGKKRRR